MNIAAWTFGRLLAFWGAGIVAEMVLIVLPALFFVTGGQGVHLRSRHVAAAHAPTVVIQGQGEAVPRAGAIPLEARRMEVRRWEARRVELRRELRAARSRGTGPAEVAVDIPAYRIQVKELKPMPVVAMRSHANVANVAVSAVAFYPTFRWWMPFIMLYLLAIPVWLVAVSVIWLFERLRRPPESPA